LCLAFYPLIYVGLILLMRSEVKTLSIGNWLNGAVAGLGTAAVSSAFIFGALLHLVQGPPAQRATKLAYPIADLVLLAIVIGGTVMLPTWQNRRWVILLVASAVVAVGDAAYLFQSTGGSYRVDTLMNITWPAAMLLISFAMWQPAEPRRTRRPEAPPHFAAPGIAAISGLAVLLAGLAIPISWIAIALATATLLAAGARLVFSLSDLRVLTEQHRLQALTDELTGLGNRRHLLGVLDEFFGGRATGTGDAARIALLLLDLDHFKEINDSFGHPVGDEILKMLGPRLKSVLRSTDVLTRLGGDEFGVVLSDADADYATAIAERLTTQIEQPFMLTVASLHVSVSIGIALAPIHGADSAELLRCADIAMYRAKAAGSAFQTYEKILDDRLGHLRLVEDLRTVIAKKGLVLYYQPQYELRTGKVVGVEALLRWHHATLGLISPDEFIPLAEEAGLMRPLTDLVLESALTQCAIWRATGRRIYVSVNLSATNLLDVGLPERIRFLLAKHRLGSDALVLEVTETTMMGDRERAQEIIQQLRQLGHVVSVDDFGTGFSSLAYLSDLAVSELKIDQALTKRLAAGDGERNRAIVRATIELGHSLGLRVVAEGVENAETYQLLGSLGCDLAQGNYMCRPLPPQQLALGPSAKDGKFNLLAPVVPRARRIPEASRPALSEGTSSGSSVIVPVSN
jgi:diguanylate cyclase (GGDEF)-like protein